MCTDPCTGFFRGEYVPFAVDFLYSSPGQVTELRLTFPDSLLFAF
jgi:hypothetical protein